MNILVLVKQTFDTEEKINIINERIVEEEAEFVVNPYDEYAVEEAVRLKEQYGGEVTVITLGPERAESALRTALAMGADKAVLVNSGDVALDEFSVGKILAAVIKDREYDIILCGNMAVDNGSGQIGPRLAEELKIAQVTAITNLEINDKKAYIKRDVEGDIESIEVLLPLLVSTQQGLNEPRYPSLPGIMKAKKKPLERLELEDLNFNNELPRTVVTTTFLPPKKEAGYILSGEIEEQVKQIVNILNNKEKVI
ncbi:electron transfer flavoprotein subunit beta/FixA family protein [Priestia flexa]|uniref:electron transfer flavoprotein subunit beta/FixA family protein n=1 Tax=Priestia flexa TaxID=86664 RepID=UPI001B32F1B4|nr:electron transfer flavoprotein subunit beta/FixA family protein [Priestia flexa]